MSSQKKVLLLVGSPKNQCSTSESLGSYLMGRLAEKGFNSEMLRIVHALKSKEGIEALLTGIESSDILVLAFPLYIDTLPAPVIRTMELIVESRKDLLTKKSPLFLAITNSGFPEAHHSNLALSSCRLFAKEAGLIWAGGLALGGGEAIAGEGLDKSGGKARLVRKSLDLTAAALADGNPPPEEAAALMAKPFVPKWMYIFFGGMGWRIRAMKNKALGKINDRPYSDNSMSTGDKSCEKSK